MKKRFTINQTFLVFLFFISITYTYAQCSFTGLNPVYCTNSPSTALTPGIPGGTFSGPGVVGSAFSPSLAGPGTATINYNICSTNYSITSATFAPLSAVGNTLSTSSFFSSGTTVNADDGTSAILPIGFNFQFFCNTYSSFYICTNGFLTFTGGQASPYTPVALFSSGAPLNMIASSWTDLNLNSGGIVTYSTVGTAPNRKLVVTFLAVAHYNAANGGYPVTAQYILYETTNVIEIHTTTMPIPASLDAAVMGIQNSTGTAASVVTGRNATSTWAATNECYRWTPGATCSVSQTTAVSPSTISVVGNNSICVGSTASLTATGNTTYTWSTSSNSNSVTVTPAASQTYSVSGTNSFGCIANSAITVTVDTTPTVTAISSNGTSGTCPGKTVSVSGAGATSYTWTGGSPTITNNVAFTPVSTNIYTVTGGNACGTATAAISVSIHPLPNVTPVASSASLCSGLNLTLTGVGNATNYAWSGWSGAITNGVGFPPTITATYTVIGTSLLSCTASASIPVTVVTTPVNFPSQNTGIVCIGGSSTLTATGATNYTWTSATQTVFTSSFVVTPNVGTTTYTITKSNSNCFDTKTISVVTNSLPTIFAIVTPTLVCALNPANLAVGGGQSYTWTAPGSPNFTFTGASPVVSPAAPSTYTVAAFDGTCVNVATVFLNVNPNPTITASASSPSICNGQSVTLTGLGGINYTWTAVTLTANLIGATVVDSPTTATAYNVTGDNIFGCTSGATAVVLVNPIPIISAAASKPTVCSGGPTTLSASASGVSANSYTWDANANGALTYSTIVNPTSPVSTSLIYTVQGHNSFPCTSSQTVQVNVFVPVLTVTGNTNTCVGGIIHLTAIGGNTGTYSWLTSIGGNPYPFPTLTATVNAAGVYTVNAVASTPIVCPATQTVAVGVYFNPTITAVPQRTVICTKESVDLYGGGGATYLWNNGTPGGTINVSPTGNTTYTVTGTDANGCVGTGTVLVKVSGCSGINELNNVNSGLVLYPNPNNGEFTIQANTELTLSLVNELGQTIRSIALSGSNNYKVSVNDLAKGIYFITGQKEGVHINQKVIVVK